MIREEKNPSRLTALVVEDNLSSSEYLKYLLKKLEISVIFARSGEDALEKVKDKDVDFMLLDIALGPGITGLGLLEEFRKQERFSKIPIIMVTTTSQSDLGDKRLEEMVNRGVTEYITKPYTFNQLKEVLSKYFSV